MYNSSTYNNVVNRVSPMNLSVSDLGYNPDTARLYLFTPRTLPTQILRSHRYNFTPDYVDRLMDTQGGGAVKLLPDNFASGGEPIICPDGNGMAVDTNVLNTLYSFVLIIDSSPKGDPNRIVRTGGSRQILIGYVSSSEEPYNPRTNTVNPRAILNFTHNNVTNIMSTIDSNGYTDGYYVAADNDHINNLTAQQLPVATYLMTPQDMLNTDVGMYDMVDGSKMCISNIHESARSIDAKLNAPVVHMSQLADAMESAVSQAHGAGEVRSTLQQRSFDDQTAAKGFLKANAPGSSALVMLQGIDPSSPMSIAELDIKMQGALIVQPYNIPASSQWDVYPQDIISPKNIMSSFASMTLTALLPQCGLAHIVFRYASWIKGNITARDGDSGWQIISCSTLVDVPQMDRQLRMLNTFKTYVNAHLFKVLRQFGGDFDLMAYINIGGEVLVDLNFLDMNTSHRGVGFYETNTRLGGMLNPMIADSRVLANNTYAINTLADTFIRKNLGVNLASARVNYSTK